MKNRPAHYMCINCNRLGACCDYDFDSMPIIARDTDNTPLVRCSHFSRFNERKHSAIADVVLVIAIILAASWATQFMTMRQCDENSHFTVGILRYNCEMDKPALPEPPKAKK